MEPKEKEEELLKSVALQTVNAALVGRRRPEQELIRSRKHWSERARSEAFAFDVERHTGVKC